MPAGKTLRESHFPAIEKRYGKTMKYWFSVIDKISDQKYPEQMKHLRNKFGLSQAHANALIMYKKGSKSPHVGCKINKKTIGVPNDWVVDKKLLQEMINYSLASSKS